MEKKTKKKRGNLVEIEDIRMRLEEAEEALRAIRCGEVDALVVTGPQGEEVFTLRGAEQPYRVFVEAMNEGAATLDHEGTVLYCNNRFAEMLKVPHDKVIGVSIYEFIPPADTSRFESAFQTGKREESRVDISFKGRDGDPLPVHLSFNVLHGQDVPVVCMVVTDLTERKRYEQEILKSHAELEMKVRERTAELTRLNETLRGEVTERKRMEDQLRKSHDELEMRVQERTEELQSINEELRAENEQRQTVEFQLRESENRLRELSTALLRTQETERKLIAGEIHDSLGASLAATKFKLEDALKQMGGENPQTRVVLENVIPMIQGTIDEARRIQMSLRPSMLDDLGILPTINWLCRQFETSYSRISISKEINIEEHEVPETLKTVIYRVLQEALNNAAKYSKASVVLLYLQKQHQEIQLVVRDSGQGFNLEEAYSRKGTAKGLGLESMRERIQFSGGFFSIESSEGAGTAIRATWPLNSKLLL